MHPAITQEALEAIINSATTQFNAFTFGPLNKSENTTNIEILLEEILPTRY